MKMKAGLWLGLLLSGTVLLGPAPPGLAPEARYAAAVAVLMTVWWLTEAAGMGMTSLLPLVLYPLFSILPIHETLMKYLDPNVRLFIGGFMLALAMQKSGLHKRIAFGMIRAAGRGPRRMLAGFMLATAFISLWVSNTAAALLMLPIGLAVIDETGEKRSEGLVLALLLGIAYSSSIGGVATLVGKPTNLIFVGEAKNLFPELPEVGFFGWSSWAFPLALGFLVLTWTYLAFWIMRGKNRGDLRSQRLIEEGSRSLGRMTSAEWRVIVVFFITVAAWVLPGKGVHDGTVAMAAVLALYTVPNGMGKGQRLLDWEWTKRLPWEVVLLLGGSFALAESFHRTGLAAWIAGSCRFLEGMPVVLLVFLLCLATSFMSELMSNTAQTAILMPLLGAVSATLGIHPYLLMIPATVAASLAFMMPIGTPPNAIVIASGRVRIPQMAKAGFLLNILGAVWVTFITFTLLKSFLGIVP